MFYRVNCSYAVHLILKEAGGRAGNKRYLQPFNLPAGALRAPASTLPGSRLPHPALASIAPSDSRHSPTSPKVLEGYRGGDTFRHGALFYFFISTCPRTRTRLISDKRAQAHRVASELPVICQDSGVRLHTPL